jgi:glycosyltransferase involved in cell wall biosynthesis
VLASKVEAELWLINDNSSDNTLEIISQLASKSEIQIRIESWIGPQAAGSSSLAYAKAIATLDIRGELVILSDHDDIWLPNRIEAILKSYSLNLAENGAWLYAGSSLLWDSSKASPLPYRSHPGPRGKSHVHGNQLNPKISMFEVAVSTHNISFNSKFLDTYRKFPLTPKMVANDIQFDNWIPFLSSQICNTAVDLTPTLIWRQHHENSSGNFLGRRSARWVKSKIIRHLRLMKANEQIFKYIMIGTIYNKYLDSYPDFNYLKKTSWDIKNIETVGGRARLALNPDWKHWSILMDFLIRLSLLRLTQESVKEIQRKFEAALE